MANNKEQMIQLEPGGKAPILSYNVPEPTLYSGRNNIEMEFQEFTSKKSSVRSPWEVCVW